MTGTAAIGQTVQDEGTPDFDGFVGDVCEGSRREILRRVSLYARWTELSGMDANASGTLREYRDYLISEGRKANYINSTIATLNRFLRWRAAEMNLPEPSKVKGIRIPDCFQKDSIPEGTIKAMMKGTIRTEGNEEGTLRDRAIVGLLVSTGLRAAECSGIDIGDCEETVQGTVIRVKRKGYADKCCTVLCPIGIWGTVKEYLATRGELTGTSPLFVSTSKNNRGERLSSDSISRMVKASLRAQGMDSERVSCHSTRHSTATILLKKGVDIPTVSRTLNHKDVRVTLRYCDAIERERTAALFDGIIGGE